MLKPLFEINFGFSIYNLMAAVGVFFATLILIKIIKKEQLNETTEAKILGIFVFSALLGLVTANITNWLFMPELFEYSLIERIQRAGLNFYGGIIGFFFFSFIGMKIFKIDYKKWINKIIPSVLIFHFFGRLGCSLAGCCYGIELFPLVQNTHLELFPAREIEAICLLVLFFCSKKINDRYKFMFYALSYGVIRFILEFARGDYRGHLFINFLSPAQVISTIIIILTLIISIIQFHKKLKLRKQMMI
ncbi:MAG: prolipoprotein diacylglyceryl transferase [Mycoplasmataceae bacterium]|jgi:phosphatidylglycerol:prolipoprotein diacylglycerol transferase|nr:prolipoprotein diacylglyceryl transferase [Mycoplasmataceae bacterium]